MGARVSFSRLNTRNLDPDEQALYEKLGLAGGRPAKNRLSEFIESIKNSGIGEALRPLAASAEEGLFDGLVEAKRREMERGVGVGANDYENSGYVGMRLASGVADMMHHVINWGALKWQGGVIQGQEGTRGIMPILVDLGPDVRAWLGWMAAHRAQELRAQGRENNLTEADIARLLEGARGKEAKFHKAHQEYAAMNKAMLDLAEQSGLIDPAVRAKWASDWYIPFYRRSEMDGELSILAPSTKRGFSHQSAAIKRLTGSELATNDLLENILTNWLKMVDASVKNDALRKTVDQFIGQADLIVNETMHYEKVLISNSQIAALIRKDRRALARAAELLGMPPEGASVLDLTRELMRPENEGFSKLWAAVVPSDPDVIRIQRGGKNEYYRVKDAGLLRSIHHVSMPAFNDPFVKLARKAKQVLTIGVTATPDFMLRNFVRDAVHSWAINPDGMKLAGSFSGLKGSYQESAFYKMMTAGGSSFQGGYVYGTDPQAGAAAIRRNLARTLNTKGDLQGAMLSMWNRYTALNDKIENASRLETFKKALEAGKPLAQALYESKDLMDYSLRGNYALVKYLADITPFLNARAQGLYKLARAGKNGKKLMAWKMVQLGIFSWVLALWNIDDDEYNALPDWEKDTYWHIIGDDYHIRIPKPFEVGIVAGVLPERLTHVLAGQQEGEKLWWSLKYNFMHTIGFDPIPHFMLPAVEVWANKSRFFKTPIVAAGDQHKADPRTSDTMVALGEWIGIHPQKLEHLVNGYFGTMGMYALGLTDMASRGVGLVDAPARPAWRWYELPGVKSFVRGDPKTSQWVTDFFDAVNQAEAMQKKIKDLNATGRRSDAREADELVREHQALLASRKQLLATRRTLADLRKQGDAIMRGNLPAEIKRQRIDEINRRRLKAAEDAVKRAKAVERSMERRA